MLSIYDQNGIDLGAVPPQPVTLDLITPNGTPLQVLVAGVENDASLAFRRVSGFIDWNDGNHVDRFSYTACTNGTLPLVATQLLAPGQHVISVHVHNYRLPVHDETIVNFPVTVRSNAAQDSVRFLAGPILPKDSGFPNASQWNFHFDKDLAVLASSVKMLIETKVGERIMLPDYGTDIWALLFEPNLSGIEALVQERLNQALTRWEPRVSLSFVSVTRQGRAVTVVLTLTSRLTQQTFDVSTTMAQ